MVYPGDYVSEYNKPLIRIKNLKKGDIIFDENI